MVQTKQWTKKKLFFYSIIVWMLILSLLEGGFRWQFRKEHRDFYTKLSIQGATLQMTDSFLVFKNRPLYVDYARRFQYNVESMKTEPKRILMPGKGPNDYWVLLLGGSAMEGMGSNKDGEWLDITGQYDYSWNESISHYLETYLNGSLIGKKVTVFNAASSSYTLAQSMLRYQELSNRYNFDFVVSLDGQNDPPALNKGETSLQYIKKDWEDRPSNHFPASWLVFLTQRSAMVYQLKQQFYHWRTTNKKRRNAEKNFPRREFWARQPIDTFSVSQHLERVDQAVDSYFKTLNEFAEYLNKNNQSFVLMLQPHLIFRDSTVTGTGERAVLSYFSHYNNDSIKNGFLLQQRKTWKERFPTNDGNFLLVDTADRLGEEVFVDYCHFTPSMNKFMARFIGEKILAKAGVVSK